MVLRVGRRTVVSELPGLVALAWRQQAQHLEDRLPSPSVLAVLSELLDQLGPMHHQGDWHGHEGVGPFKSSQQAYDTLHIGDPKQAALAAIVTDPNIKHVIVVDDDVDVFNETQVLWALAMRFQADRDLVIIPNIIGSHLNPTAYGFNRMEKGPMETKLIFDATKPLPPYHFPKEAQAPDEVLNKIDLARDTRPYEPGRDDKAITGS